jgi:hypothetical protein
MKTILTLIAFTVALNFSSFAQQTAPQKRTPEDIQKMVAKRQTDKFVKDFKLDVEQAKAVGEVNLKYAALRAQVIESSKQEKGVNVREKMVDLNKKRENEIVLLLNEEQTAAYNAKKQELEQRREELRKKAEQRNQQDSQN